jgi:hypothetical protein
MRMAWDKWEKEEDMGRMARKRGTGEGILPRIPRINNHQSTTLTICLGTMAGPSFTIPATLQHCKRAQNIEFNKPSFNSGKLWPHTQPTPPPSKHRLIVLSWQFISTYKSQGRLLQCNYGQERTASMPSSNRHVCPRSSLPFAAVGG